MEKKKILIISPHFYPETFKCNDVAFSLAQKGYDVTALSDIPNYPGGVFFKGYGLFHKRKEIVDGVKIIRTAVVPRNRHRIHDRILHVPSVVHDLQGRA